MARRWAVLIDAENIAADVAGPLFERVKDWGDAAVRRMFANFDGNHQGWKAAGAQHSIEPVHLANMVKGKNGADIALVIDALDLMHRGHVDGFCIVSSDSDFTRLAWRLRAEGKQVRGVGNGSTAASFQKACSEFFTVEALSAPIAPPVKPVPKPGTSGFRAPQGAIDAIRRAIDAASPVDGWAQLSTVGSILGKAQPKVELRGKLSEQVRQTGAFDERRNKAGMIEIRPKR